MNSNASTATRIQVSTTNEGDGGDERLGGLLNSLSGQVHDAFTRLGELHEEIRVRQREVVDHEERMLQRSGELDQWAQTLDDERKEISSRRDRLEARVNELDELRARFEEQSCDLEARERALAVETEAAEARAEEFRAAVADLERREADVLRREVDLVTAADELEDRRNEIAALNADLEVRSAAASTREKAISSYHDALGRLQTAIVTPAPSDFATAEPSFDMGDNDVEPIEPTSSDADSAPTDTRTEAKPPASTVDLSDFSPDEHAKLHVRRRLRAYSDEFLASEIRSERAAADVSKKPRGWFRH